jgi:nucleotide-binding universal stress UspA family protein
MDKVIWFIDTRSPEIGHSTIKKIIDIVNSFAVPIDIILDKRTRSVERLYLPDWPEDKQQLARHRTQQNQFASELQRSLSDKNIKHRIVDVVDADYMTVLNKCLNPSVNNLLIINDQPLSKRHPIFQHLCQLPCSVLLLTTKPWHSPFNVLAAVDPLHENARPQTLDTTIVEWARKWGDRPDAEWQLVHCCFVSPLYLKHKKAIVGIHTDELDNFARASGVPKSKTRLLQGNPESVLPQYIKESQTDLLVIGLVARTRLRNFLVGSTTTLLLASPPCDMLFIKTI